MSSAMLQKTQATEPAPLSWLASAVIECVREHQRMTLSDLTVAICVKHIAPKAQPEAITEWFNPEGGLRAISCGRNAYLSTDQVNEALARAIQEATARAAVELCVVAYVQPGPFDAAQRERAFVEIRAPGAGEYIRASVRAQMAAPDAGGRRSAFARRTVVST